MSRAALTGFAVAISCVWALAQDFSEIKVEQLAKGYTFTEGPAWSKDGYLIFSDTPTDRLLKWVPGHPVEVFRENAGGPSGNAFDAEGRLYTCETRARRVSRTDKKGGVEVVAERWEGKRLNAPNDIVVSKTGHVYFTDPAFGEQSDRRELDFYGIYAVPPKAQMKLVAKSTGRPNGIALSPNGRILYVVNSDERNVRAYDLDKNGDASNERVLISKIEGVPGGIRVDEKGNLYITAKGVAIYTADGKPVHVIPLHARASNCGFGEADLHTLFVTEGPVVYRIRLDLKGAY
ncbi:MAG TPA: SMP-30/gluconolactonase/LRE family protein [Bryobacteraceae bacterium]|nr:SMP-30/gluconolactonase/LRE family protein [Bryobacteraceae bacterium]